MNIRAIENEIKKRKSEQEKEDILKKQIETEAQKSLELSQRPIYREIDFFLSSSPKKTKEEYQAYIVSALNDDRRADMLEWLQQKYKSSYPIQKIPDIFRFSEIFPIKGKWKVVYHEECVAHSWQISREGYWDESGDISDVALQIYENGYVILTRGIDVRGFRLK